MSKVHDPITGKPVRRKSAKNQAGGPVRGEAPPATPVPRTDAADRSYAYDPRGIEDCRVKPHLADFADTLAAATGNCRERLAAATEAFRAVIVDQCLAAANKPTPEEAGAAWDALEATVPVAEAKAAERIDRELRALADTVAGAAADVAGPLDIHGYHAPDSDDVANTVGELLAGKYADGIEVFGELVARCLTRAQVDALVAGLRR